jgi:hypothetical protein
MRRATKNATPDPEPLDLVRPRWTLRPDELDALSHLSRLSWLSYALHGVERGKIGFLFQLSTFEDQNAGRGLEKLARDRQPSRTTTNYDNLSTPPAAR